MVKLKETVVPLVGAIDFVPVRSGDEYHHTFGVLDVTGNGLLHMADQSVRIEPRDQTAGLQCVIESSHPLVISTGLTMRGEAMRLFRLRGSAHFHSLQRGTIAHSGVPTRISYTSVRGSSLVREISYYFPSLKRAKCRYPLLFARDKFRSSQPKLSCLDGFGLSTPASEIASDSTHWYTFQDTLTSDLMTVLAAGGLFEFLCTFWAAFAAQSTGH